MSYRLCSLGGGHSGSKHELWQPFSWPDGIGQRPDHLSKLEAGYCSCLRQLRGASQVWPLTQFSSVSFLWKIIDLPEGQINFFTVSGSTLLRENVFIPVPVYPDFLLALEPGEKNWGRRKKSEAGEKSIKQEKKDFFSCLLGILASD